MISSSECVVSLINLVKVETTITYTHSPITTTESTTGATIEGRAATDTNSMTMVSAIRMLRIYFH